MLERLPLVSSLGREISAVLVCYLEDASKAALSNDAVDLVLAYRVRVDESWEVVRIAVGVDGFCFCFWTGIHQCVYHRAPVGASLLSLDYFRMGGGSRRDAPLNVEQETVRAFSILGRLLSILGPLRGAGAQSADLLADTARSRGETLSEGRSKGGKTIRVNDLGRLQVVQACVGGGRRDALGGRFGARGQGRRQCAD